jgi:hypothetical protein
MTTLDSITLNVNGATLVLTLETARELYAELGKLFGPQYAKVRVPVNGLPPLPQVQEPIITWTTPDTGQHPRPFGSDIVCEGKPDA